MIVVNPINSYSLKYILAILNSRLMSFWFIHTYGKLQRKVFPQFKVKELREFPIRVIDFENNVDLELHNQIISCVDSLEVKAANFFEANTKLDRLIYALYGITEDEINLIES